MNVKKIVKLAVLKLFVVGEIFILGAISSMALNLTLGLSLPWGFAIGALCCILLIWTDEREYKEKAVLKYSFKNYLREKP